MEFIQIAGAVFIGTLCADIALATYAGYRHAKASKARYEKLLQMKADYEYAVSQKQSDETETF